MEEYDVLVVGGGPSGLSTAFHLARRKTQDFSPSMLILEKERYPRPKVCAGGLTLDAERILQSLDLNVSEIPHADAESVRFNFEGGGLNICIKSSHALRVIRRDEFDAWLAKKAKSRGVEIKEGITVKNIIPDDNGVTVETNAGNFRAKVVVGADGSNGVTRGRVLPNPPLRAARALEVITDVIESRQAKPVDKTEERFRLRSRGEREAYFDFFPVPRNIAGYTWDFPAQVKGHPMRCQGIYDATLFFGEKRPPLKEPLAEEMLRDGLNLSDYELKGHPIRWYDPSSPISAPRVILVGDAAGADPLFGEGISMALGYGLPAAQEIENAFRQNDFSFGGYKRRIRKSGLGQTLLARWVIAHLVYGLKWRWFQFLLWRVFKPIVLLVAWTFILNWSKRLK